MTRIRSTFATLLLMAAAVAALGIGAALAMAGLAIGLVVAELLLNLGDAA